MSRYDDDELMYVPSEPPLSPEEEEQASSGEFTTGESVAVSESAEDEPIAELAESAGSETILEIAQTLVAHGERLSEHDESITWLLEKFKKESQDRPVFWSWKYATGEARGELWEIINDFVSWINHRYFADYRSKQIVPCWYRHGAIVEELTGLWAAWWDASYNAKKPNTKMADFHRRYFWPAMDQIWSLSGECIKKGEHSIAGRSVVRADDEGMRAFISDDVQASVHKEEPEQG